MALDVSQYEDPRWRLSNLYFIVNKKGHRVKFEPNPQQLEYMLGIHGRDIILKARQLGFTTLAALVSLDECLWTPNWSTAIIAHTKPDAQKILKTKVAYPYSQLPDGIKAEVWPINDAADTFALSNNSSVVVTNSARGGTLQRLHVSEFGKICARFPEKAQEIVSGSFPAAEHGCITIESTAEGQQGRFFEMTQKALAKKDAGKGLSPLDYKLHFFPWWENDEYQVNPGFVTITSEDRQYFERLERDHGISLTPEQKAWWVKQEETQGGTMKREYPATPQEAFEQALEGAYFEQQFAHSYKHKKIGRFPLDPYHEVNTFWDLGRNDINAIWLHQRIDKRNRFVGYYENSGEFIGHYIQWLKDWRRNNGVSWGEHYWPHDGDRQDLFLENGRLDVVKEMGFRPKVVARESVKIKAIEAARSVFPDCDFDEVECSLGLKRLKHYRKEWDTSAGVWKNKPLHDDNSNAADGFMTFATGYKPVDGKKWSSPKRGIKGL